jgi:hypothetical protein
MGTGHAKYLIEGEVNNAVLTAVSDVRESRLSELKAAWGDTITYFNNNEVMITQPRPSRPSDIIYMFLSRSLQEFIQNRCVR